MPTRCGCPWAWAAPRAAAFNTTDGPTRLVSRRPAASAGAAEAVDHVTRSEWGADEALRFASDGTESWPKTFHPVQKLTVHHTATGNDDPTTVPGYRLGADGVTWEGVTAAHVSGWNSGNVGISLLGNMTDRRPTAGAQRGLERMLAEAATRSGIDPKGSSTYVNPVDGKTWTGPNVPGHRDFAATECPGGATYALLPTIRQRVADRIAGTLVEDTTAPVISGEAVSTTATSAKISWLTTADPSDSQVQWRKKGSSAFTTTPLDLTFAEGHVVSISKLRRRTAYEYRVISADVAGNRTVGPVLAFTTAK